MITMGYSASLLRKIRLTQQFREMNSSQSVVVHSFNLSAQKPAAGRCLEFEACCGTEQVSGHPGLLYRENLSQETKRKRKK